MTGIAWAPALPDHWTHCSLRWLASIYAGGTPDRENPEYWTNGSIPWLNSGSVNDWVITEPSELISEAGFAHSSARWVPAGSVVVGLAGQGKTKGTAARLEIDSTTNQSMVAIVPGPSLDYRYLHYWLASNYQSLRNLAGGDKRDGLNLRHISAIECPLPPVGEQRVIADYLDRETAQIDTLIAKQEQLISTLRERKHSIVAATVTRGLDQSIPFRETGIAWLGAVPAHWRTKPLWSMYNRVKDINHPEEQMLSVFREHGVVVKDEHANINKTAENRSIYQLIHPGWLAANRMKAWQGSVGVSPHRGIISGHYICFEPKHHESDEFLNWLFRSPTYAAGYGYISRGVRIGQAEIDNDDYRILPVVLPPLDEQAAIADSLTDQVASIDALAAKAEQFIALARERRAALITAAVTGQIDISTAA